MNSDVVNERRMSMVGDFFWRLHDRSLRGGRDQRPFSIWPRLLILVVLTLLSQECLAKTPLTTLRRETRELLRQQAIEPAGERKDDALTALCDLYVLLRQDSRYSQSEMLQQDAAKIRRRLLTVASRREAQLKRDEIPKSASLSSDVDAAIREALKSEDPGSLGKLAFQGGQAAGGFDNGWQLVELIERIVEPDFWDAQGGPGTIRYFAMRRVLVVRATSDVHEQIRELLLSL